ncbi:FxLYD domain-containing protein [Halobiforma nitratireducens]|uniref:Uncharacterized protein n=1 Tax=Halobiforma nitratireducens JCM 10879 TaxID=1227454 RepID=M0M833_9EURY|nr:FxLYD domain-containing protein [Halobiforma nitratireducens]EMA40535.1 hypothetical protein C446_07317 [Halobiforma nitratireducens JCM 10879]
MIRRRLLAAAGAVGAAAVAGCNAVTGDEAPRYESGTIDVEADGDGDGDGDDRSAEEMTAADALAEQDINEGVTPLDALSIDDHEFVLEDDFRGPTIQGTVTNAGDDPIQVVEVRARVADANGAHLGRYLATTGDLGSESKWAFEVILLESPDEIDSYDVTVLGTPT